MCLCTQSCVGLTKQEKKTIKDVENVIEDVVEIETGIDVAGCEGGSCGRDKGKNKHNMMTICQGALQVLST